MPCATRSTRAGRLLEGLTVMERVWGKPQYVKENSTDYYSGGLGYGGYDSVFYDPILGRYVMYTVVRPTAWLRASMPSVCPGPDTLFLHNDRVSGLPRRE